MSSASSNRRRHFFRLAAINCLILVGLWMTALFLLSVGADVSRIAGDLMPGAPDERASLPSYDDPERAAQIYRDQNRSRHQYMPYTGWRSIPLTSGTVNIDENGFRIHSVGLDNSTNAKTIGFFRGSAMWGTGSDNNSTVPALFDQLSSDYNVRNYADLAWVSRQNLAQLINLANQHQAPDVVVFYDGYNDVHILCNRAFTESLNGTAREGRLRSIIELRKAGWHVYRNLILPFIELLMPQHSGDASEQYSCDRDPKMAQRVADVFVQNWSIAAQIVESYGGTFIGFLQPGVFTGTPRVDHLPDNVNANWRDRDALQREFDAVYPIIRGKLSETGIRWKDLTNVFDSDQYYYVDTSHVGPRGNSLIVKHMMDFIKYTSENGPLSGDKQ
jgi:hypothetical protein